MRLGLQALGRLPAGTMNKTETAYSKLLETLVACEDVLWWKFEGLKLRLAPATFYSPDFVVMRNTGALECHEVKGHWQDDARVKIKVAASIYPFKFIAAQPVAKAKGSWKIEEF